MSLQEYLYIIRATVGIIWRVQFIIKWLLYADCLLSHLYLGLCDILGHVFIRFLADQFKCHYRGIGLLGLAKTRLIWLRHTVNKSNWEPLWWSKMTKVCLTLWGLSHHFIEAMRVFVREKKEAWIRLGEKFHKHTKTFWLSRVRDGVVPGLTGDLYF